METRQAIPGEDDQLLFEFYVSSRREEMASWGWDAEEQRKFLQMQHSCQQHSYQMQYANLDYKIILFDGAKVGRIITAVIDREMVLVDIILLPEFQNKGIGSVLLKQLQQDAATTGRSVRLSVLAGNPAKRFYEKCGFQPVDNVGIYTIMRWIKPEEE